MDADEASKTEERVREAARKAANEKANEHRRINEANERARHDAERARVREAKRIERDNARGNSRISPTVFAVTLLCVALAVLGLVFLTIVSPLQRKLSETQVRL